jgi:hypothetical protein
MATTQEYHMSPEIPINPMDLPTEVEPLDETATYTGTISKVTEVNIDKNGDSYFGITVRVSEPEEDEGRMVGDNYIRLPGAVTPDMTAKERKRALQSADRLGRLCRSAQFNPGARPWNTDELVGLEVHFLVKNEEYQGRIISKINDYVFSS